MLYRWPPNRQQTKHYRSDAQWSRSVLAVLFVGWLFGTPWLWLHGAFVAAPLFGGVTPTHDQKVEAATFMRWAVACGLLLPLTGLILSLATSQPIAAWLFGSAFTLTLVALFATGTVQNLNTNNTDGPTTSVVTPTRTPCAEHSGGVPRCPGD